MPGGRTGRIGSAITGRAGHIKSVQRGTTTGASATVTAVDTNKSIVTFLGQKLTTSGATCDGPPYAALTAATTVSFTGGSGSSVTRGYQVLERY